MYSEPDPFRPAANEEESLTAAMVALHEQLVNEPESCGDLNTARHSGSRLTDDVEFDDLAYCLELLERTRRFVRGETPVCEGELQGSSIPPAKPEEIAPHAARIGRFEIVRELGRGGLGVVLLAYDPVLKRQVALKIPNPEGVVSPSLRRRFQREGRAAARLSHPHIVPVYEVGDVGPICFIAAAYVEGPNLAQWMAARGKTCEPELASRLIADLAEAMQYAHEQHVLHRDLKPSNILLEKLWIDDGDDEAVPREPSAKITDFGLAKFIDQAEDETRHGTVLGTPAYMSPEQARGDLATIGRASDVYSLGAVLYELLSGRTPYDGESEAKVLAQLLGPDEPLALGRIKPGLSRDLQAICRRCLEKEPAGRYATAGELAADLRRYLAGEPTQARPLSAAQRAGRWARRKPALAALVGVSITATIALVLGGAFYAQKLNRAVVQSIESALAAQMHQAEAVKQESRVNEQLYIANMRLADLALHEGNPGRAHVLLMQYADGSRLAQLRGIEWYLLYSEYLRTAGLGAEGATVTLDHQTPIYTATALADTRFVATGGLDGRLRIWDHTERRVVHDIKAHIRSIPAMRVSPDGTLLATVSCDLTAALWRLTGEHILEFVRDFRHEHPARFLAWSPDGRWLATATSLDDYSTQENVLHVWDVASGEKIHEAPCEAARGMMFTPDGRYLVTAGYHRIRTFLTSNWEMHGEYRADKISDAQISPEGIVTYIDHQVGLCELDPVSNRMKLILKTHRPLALAWDAKGRRLAYLAEHAMVRILYPDKAYESASFCQANLGSRFSDFNFSRDGRFLVSSDFGGRVSVTELAARTTYNATAIYPNPPGKRLVPTQIEADASFVTLRGEDQSLYRLKLDTDLLPTPLSSADLQSRLREVPPTKFATNFGKRRIEQTQNGELTIRYLDEDRVEPLAIKLDVSIRESFVFPSTNRGVVLAKKQLTVVDLTSKTILYQEADQAYEEHSRENCVALSADGRWLVTTTWPDGVRLIDLKSGKKRELFKSDDTSIRLLGLTISADGRRAAVIRGDTTIYIWDASSGQLLHMTDVGSYARSLTLDKNGRSIIVATDQGLQVWHVDTGQRIAELPLGNDAHVAQFSDDGRTVYCVSEDGTATEIYRWRLDQKDVEAASTRAPVRAGDGG